MKQNIFVGIASLFGVLEIIVFCYMLTGKTLYILNTSKKYFIACFSIGFIMCCFGITRNLKELNWLNPLTIIACVLGAAAFVVFYWLLFKEKSVSDARDDLRIFHCNPKMGNANDKGLCDKIRLRPKQQRAGDVQTSDLSDLEEFLNDAAAIGVSVFELSTMQVRHHVYMEGCPDCSAIGKIINLRS